MYTFTQNCFLKSLKSIMHCVTFFPPFFGFFCWRTNTKIKYQTGPRSHTHSTSIRRSTFCAFIVLVACVSCMHARTFFFVLFMRSLPAAEPLSSWVNGYVFFLPLLFSLVQKTLLLRLSWLYYLATAIFTPICVVKSGPGKIQQKITKMWWFGFKGTSTLLTKKNGGRFFRIS